VTDQQKKKKKTKNNSSGNSGASPLNFLPLSPPKITA